MILLFLAASVVSLVMSNPLFENATDGKIWALLVAGSFGYENYRHQADICHAYQILHRHGIPDENIVVMMYDDIAFHRRNPYKGIIMNRPNGTNVYRGVVKDYTGKDVNVANFLNVLQGNKEAMNGTGSGKVIESGPNDRVFVNFADHGGSGVIYFPDEELHVDDLTNTLKNMIEKNSFKELLFYLEACLSGSMFDEFLKGKEDIKIVASTAANPEESSWSVYCETSLGTCLGDEYSVSWMEHVDKTDGQPIAETETVEEQYHAVTKRVLRSHPQLYGGNHIKHEKVHKFIGLYKNNDSLEERPNKQLNEYLNINRMAVPSRDVVLYTALQQLKLAKTEEDRIESRDLVKHLTKGRKLVDDTFEKIVSKVAGYNQSLYTSIISKPAPLDTHIMACYKNFISQFKKICFDSTKNIYVLSHYYKLANMCSYSAVNIENVVSIFDSICTDVERSASGIH